LHGKGKPAALHDAELVPFTDCANWTQCVTWYIAGTEGVSPSVSWKVRTEWENLQL